MAEPPHTVRAAPPSVLRRMWLYAVVITTGILLWLIVWGSHLEAIPETASDDLVGSTGALMLVDIALGVVVVSVLPFRRRAPLVTAIVTSATLVLSASATGAAVVAIVHLAVVGSRLGLALTGIAWTLAFLGNAALVLIPRGTGTGTAEALISVALSILLYTVLVAVGRYRRARAETLTLLRERAEHSERKREREVTAAREAERLVIAREMHDVLAHRISLVAMHAGALTYRDDLPREKITEAAHVIQQSTALALTELRGLLGVLRSPDVYNTRSPQPTLHHLPILLADTRAAGVTLELDFSGIEVLDEQPVLEGLNEATSRAAYRIVQEALTNSRKHAPSKVVHVRLAHEGDQLVIESRNRMPENVTATTPSGMGLVGLAERAQIAGGTLTSRPIAENFVVKAELPWS